MIGGNGYTEKPTAELISRWIQANTFMPAMQFSYLPWEFTSENVIIIFYYNFTKIQTF